MVQSFNPTPVQSQASMLGNALGMGISKNFEPPEQRVQRGVLSKAFEDLQGAEKGDYLGQLKAIAPTLMTAPGGAELLNTLAPMLRQQAQNDATIKAIENNFGAFANTEAGNKAGIKGLPNEEEIQKTTEQKINPESPKNRFRQKPEAALPEEGNYPQTTAGPKVQPLLSPQQQRAMVQEIIKNSGGTKGLTEASAEVAMMNNQIQLNNDQILKEQQMKDITNKEMSQGVVEWAKNSRLIPTDANGNALNPTDEDVIQKLALEYKNEPTPAAQKEKVRTAFRSFRNAQESVKRESELPGQFEKMQRKLLGNYKDKETVIRNLQPHIKKYVDLGLFDEARRDLKDLGLGQADVEATIFPLSKQETKDIKIFPENKFKEKYPGGLKPFPGTETNLKPEQFDSFKKDLDTYLKSNPDANLVTLRGRLVDEKGYSWPDVSKAIDQLIAEEEFVPDYVQDSQLLQIGKAPLPGLAEIFKFVTKETK